MAARNVIRADLVESTRHETNGDGLDDHAVIGGRGPSRARKVRGKSWMAEKGRSRNLVIPDSLYDAMCILAIKTKITVGEGRNAHQRSLSVSEVACEAIAAYLVKAASEEKRRGNGDAEQPLSTD
jgi:hypothetical protein